MSRLRDLALLSMLIFGLSACGGKSGSAPAGPDSPAGGGTGSSGGSTTSGGTSTSTGSQTGGNFLDNFPLNRITSGGVPKDGIPALTDPDFVSPTSADAGYLSDDDLVLGVFINGDAKAYPHNIGWWHEIVNDGVGENPIVVTFCPLTGTGLVFEGSGGGRSDDRLTMGVSGLLFNNNLIMYDRRDDRTLFPQMIHKGVEGPGSNEALKLLPVVETTWGYWKRLYPSTTVVSGNTPGSYGLNRYRVYPYGGYMSPTSGPLFSVFPALGENPTSQLYSPKHLTLGVRFNENAKAYPFPALGQEAVINDTVAGQNILVVWYAREQLAVPYFRTYLGRTLTFERVTSTDLVYPFMLKDKETGSTWNLKGQAVSGELKDARLHQVSAHNAFWFAWATFWQNTEVYVPSN